MWEANIISYKGNTNFIKAYQGAELIWGGKPQSGNKIVGYDVWLIDFSASKMAVIKVVKPIAGLGLKEAKDLIESAPVSIIQTDSEEIAQSVYNEMTAVGDDVVAEIRYIYE